MDLKIQTRTIKKINTILLGDSMQRDYVLRMKTILQET